MKVKRKITMLHFLLITIMCISGIFLNACSSIASNDEMNHATPDIPNWGSTPTGPPSLMPESPNCALIDSPVIPGPSWRSLTIGISTYTDLLRELPSATVGWNTYAGNLHLLNSERTPGNPEDWVVVEACFTDAMVLSVLNTDDLDWPSNVDEWVAEYGPPDRVTWTTQYLDRSLIWAEEGLLAVVDMIFGDTFEVFLFSPISPHDLDSSWLMRSLPSEMPPSLGDEWELAPEQEVEDPWGIEK